MVVLASKLGRSAPFGLLCKSENMPIEDDAFGNATNRQLTVDLHSVPTSRLSYGGLLIEISRGRYFVRALAHLAQKSPLALSSTLEH